MTLPSLHLNIQHGGLFILSVDQLCLPEQRVTGRLPGQDDRGETPL